MSNITTRMKKRMAVRKMSLKQLNQRLEDVQGSVIATVIALVADVEYDDGISPDDTWIKVNKIIDKYNSVKDLDKYALAVYEKTGIGIARTEEEK